MKPLLRYLLLIPAVPAFSQQFTEINPGLAEPPFPCVAVAGYDGDGDLDAIIVGYDAVRQVPRSILYRNDGGAFVDSGATFHDLYLRAAQWLDHDNDGDLDLLLAGNNVGADILRIYRNNNVTQNTAPGAPGNLAANVLGTSVELSWDAATDAQTPAVALSYNLRVGATPGGSEIVAPQSSGAGYRRVVAMGNAQLRRIARLRGLVPGMTYYWSVQSVDTGFAGSAFTAEGSFVALADPPQNVAIVRESGGAIRTTWRGTPGASYRVDISPDLQGWTPAATPTAAAGTGLFGFLETPATGVERRCYRAARP